MKHEMALRRLLWTEQSQAMDADLAVLSKFAKSAGGSSDGQLSEAILVEYVRQRGHQLKWNELQ